MPAARVLRGQSDESELIQAAMRGDVANIERLLSTDHHLQRRSTLLSISGKKVALNINATDKMGRTALHWIASQGHGHCLEIVMERLETNFLVSNKDGRTPLHEAAMKGHINIVEKFLTKDTCHQNINQEDHHKRTALHWAVLGGYETIVRILVQYGADVKKTSDDRKTALHLAVNAGHDAIRWILLRAWTAQVGDEGVIRKFLDDDEIQADAKDEEGQTLLHYASRSGHEAIVKLLVEKGADIEVKGQYGWTPLLSAAAGDQYGDTPLLWAATGANEAVIKLLVEKGANIEVKNQIGRTPLACAAASGREAVVKLLVEKGADINAEHEGGETPLSLAVKWAHKAVVKLLIEKGADIADIEAKDKDGKLILSEERIEWCKGIAASITSSK
ncbi:hypothetical protein TrVFT333_006784 [Trichoderma virens FT-333]|nr:hypothetical protein TrVFT333_006784 [Trichoderma virens FT-333]